MRRLILHRLFIIIFVFFSIIYTLFSFFTIIISDEYCTENTYGDNIVGHWKFDADINGYVIDYSKIGNHGSLKGAIIKQDSAYFNGIDNFIEINDKDEYSISNTGALTISFWVRPHTFEFRDTNNHYVNFLGKGSFSPANQEWAFRVYSDRHSERARNYAFYVFNLSGGLGVGSRITEPQIAGEWVHIVGMSDGNKTYIYFNGEFKDSDSYSDYSIVSQNGDSPLTFGRRDESSGHFQGDLDEIMLFNRKLTDNEIKQLYLSQKEMFE